MSIGASEEMISIFMSDKTIVRVENLHLVFELDVHRSWTMRDAFTRLARDPFFMLKPDRDRLHLIDDVSFDIKEDERVGLLGVNGVGKTSLCRVLAGMYTPTRGKVEIQRPVRAIFSTAVGIQPELTGRENAELLASLLFPGEPSPDTLVQEALEFSELGKFVDVPYKFYSNGMQARLCLSLISARPTRLLILDEVFDGADTFFKKKIAARVLKMIHESGAAIFVSHSPDQVLEVCNRVMVVHQGKIAFDGKPDEAIAFYESLMPDQSEVQSNSNRSL